MSARCQSTLDTGEVIQDPQIGDYPNLPRYSNQSRGPFGWDDPQDKRNFGEAVTTTFKIICIKLSLTIPLLTLFFFCM
jgi:hypothetical protein